jgi:hypothetical protein
VVLAVDNHRVLHGRKAFVGYRNLLGFYMDRDMVESKMRQLGVQGIRE